MKCSVVIPTRNDSGYLNRCLTALSLQTHQPDEIVVVDNGSTDNIAPVLAAHPHVRCVSEDMRGVAYAVRTGYDAAQHPLILRCDADSVPPPNWVERMVTAMEYFAANPRGYEVVAISGMARFGPRWAAAGAYVGALYVSAYRAVGGLALGHPALWGSNMAVSAQWWASVRDKVHLSTDIHDDYDLSFQLTRQQRMWVDRRSVMQVSWRAAASPSRIVRQLSMAWHTVTANWDHQLPWQRMRAHWRSPRG